MYSVENFVNGENLNQAIQSIVVIIGKKSIRNSDDDINTSNSNVNKKVSKQNKHHIVSFDGTYDGELEDNQKHGLGKFLFYSGI